MLVLCPPTVTVICTGKAPSGTVLATKLFVSELKFSQAGNGSPLLSLTCTGASGVASAKT